MPFAAAGGIGDSRTMLAVLVSGADAAYMGTAFLATEECSLPNHIKENIIKAVPDHPNLISELLNLLSPEDYQKWTLELENHERRKVPPVREKTKKLGEQESFGPRLKGPYSFACAYMDRIVTVNELVEGIIKGAEEIINQLKEKWELIT